MAHAPVADLYRESLAEAGVDGSMRHRLRDANSSAKVFGKTGSLATVRALSGYVQSESGELLAYSFLMNGSGAGTWRARSVQDEALKLLADY
jgi:D-alanyl-D-alanine carboxypeptidase/D-alanyl-D-alanine-endopeptidase (penicillin-binding protein 4)